MVPVTAARARVLRAGACAALAGVVAVIPVSAAGPSSTGPSSSASPYVVPMADGVETRSILTVGDAIDGYRLVGIPDGMGVLEEGGSFRLIVNHELRPDRGIGRAHGGTGGAFVSEWDIASQTLRVNEGEDVIQTAYFWTARATRPGRAPRRTSTASAPVTSRKRPRSGTRRRRPGTTAASS